MNAGTTRLAFGAVRYGGSSCATRPDAGTEATLDDAASWLEQAMTLRMARAHDTAAAHYRAHRIPLEACDDERCRQACRLLSGDTTAERRADQAIEALAACGFYDLARAVCERRGGTRKAA